MLVILIHEKGRGLKRLARHSSRPVFMQSGDGTAFADGRSAVGPSLTAQMRKVARDLGGCLKEKITQGTCDLDIVRA